ncbi:MAG: 16S rRNA (uracil(1498)-N(3))-methyltransferase [Candidatus Binatia bacterium]
MNTVLLEPAEIAAADGGRVRLANDRRVEHVRNVHRAKVGDSLRVGALGGRLGSATVVSLDDGGLELDVVVFDRDPPLPLPLVLILALPRPKVMRRVLQTVAALGVKRLVLIATWRVEKSYWESPWLAATQLREQLLLGLEQACDTVLPVVTLHRRFKPFVEDELADLAGDSRRLLAHPAAATPCPRVVGAPVTLVIGPEGALTQYEVDALTTHGCEPVSLGPRILRVEQAVPALIGRLF